LSNSFDAEQPSQLNANLQINLDDRAGEIMTTLHTILQATKIALHRSLLKTWTMDAQPTSHCFVHTAHCQTSEGTSSYGYE
jgi:hypothetical protein